MPQNNWPLLYFNSFKRSNCMCHLLKRNTLCAVPVKYTYDFFLTQLTDLPFEWRCNVL